MKLEGDTQRVPLRERNRRRIVQRIMDAAFELFHTAGYGQTTMDAIADRAEVSRGTLFNYFPSKISLLLPFASQLFKQQIQPEMRSYLETQPTTLEALRFLFLEIGKQLLTLPDMELALQRVFISPPFSEKVAIDDIGYIETLLTIMRHGRQRGEIRSDIPVEQLAHYIGILYFSLIHAVDSQSSSEQYTSAVEMLLSFLRTALCEHCL